MSTDGRPSDRSLGQLVGTVTSDVSALLRLEIELAKSELQEQAKKGAAGAAFVLVAATLGGLALVLASVAAAFALALVVPTWAGFLIVAGVYLLIAALLVFIAVRRFKTIKGPERTQAVVMETKESLQSRQAFRSQAAKARVSVEELHAEIAEEGARQAAQAAGAAARPAPPTS